MKDFWTCVSWADPDPEEVNAACKQLLDREKEKMDKVRVFRIIEYVGPGIL